MKDADKVTGYGIEIQDPNALIRDIGSFLSLKEVLPSTNLIIHKLEDDIFKQVDKPKVMHVYNAFVFQKINTKGIEEKVNYMYVDGIDIEMEDENAVRIPYNRTLRTRPKEITEPTMQRGLSMDAISINLGNENLLQHGLKIARFSEGLLALSESFDRPEGKNR